MSATKREKVAGSGRRAGSGVMGRSLRVRLPADEDARLVAAAARAGVTQSEFVRFAIGFAISEGVLERGLLER